MAGEAIALKLNAFITVQSVIARGSWGKAQTRSLKGVGRYVKRNSAKLSFIAAQVPLLVVLWFHPHRLAPFLAAVTFIFAAITDWADGYIARRVRTSLPEQCLHNTPATCANYNISHQLCAADWHYQYWTCCTDMNTS